MRVLSTNFGVNSDFHIPNSILVLSAKKYAVLTACRHQYFTNGLSTLVNGEVVVLIPKGRTVKIVKYIDVMVALFKSNLNKKPLIPSA